MTCRIDPHSTFEQRQLAVLEALQRIGRPASTSDIGQTLGISHFYVRRLVPPLIDEGWIEAIPGRTRLYCLSRRVTHCGA